MEEKPSKEQSEGTSVLVQASVMCLVIVLIPFFLGMPGSFQDILVTMVIDILAAVLGIAGLIAVQRSKGRLLGHKMAKASIVMSVVIMGLLVLQGAGIRSRDQAPRLCCGANLHGLGRAMSMYAQDYRGSLPRTGDVQTLWSGSLPDWAAIDRSKALGMDKEGEPGRATVGSSLYLLIKYAECTPKMFVCKGDTTTDEFHTGLYKESKGKEMQSLWDFGPEPWKYYNYSYHLPFGEFALTTNSAPGTAVLADRNPWIAQPGDESIKFSDFIPYIKPLKGTAKKARYGNSPNHHRKGQNVLFIDGHVNFEKRPFCGIDSDNIYTRWDGQDKIRGILPDMTTQPADKKDSLLVHDPPTTKR